MTLIIQIIPKAFKNSNIRAMRLTMARVLYCVDEHYHLISIQED